MKKIACILLSATLSAVVLAGCGGGTKTSSAAGSSTAPAASSTADPSTPAESTATDTTTPVTISYLETQPTESKTILTKAMLDAFTAKNPNVTIEFQSTPNDQATEKLMTLAAGNKLPDIIELNDSWLAPLASTGHLEDLDAYVANWAIKDDIVDAAYKLGRVMDNKLYYLPYGLWGTAVYYNEEMLKATGLAAPVTTEDFYNVAKAMTNADAGKYGYSFRGGMYGPTHAIMWMLSETGTPDIMVDGKSVFDSPEAIKGLQKYADMYKVSPPDSTSWAFRECVSGFTSGVTGLLIQSNEVVGICNEQMGEGKFNTTMLPVGSSGKTFDTSGQTGYAMSAKSENKDVAFALLTHLMDAETSKDFIVGMGFTPANKKLSNDPAFAEGPIKVYMEQVLSGNIQFANNPSYLPEWGEFVGAYGTNEIQRMFLGEQTAEQTGKNLATYLNDAQAKYDATKK